MKFLSLKSPAKINISLRILRRRPDGYHDMVSLFHRISLSDTLTFRKIKQGIQLKCSRPDLACDETNLIVKAYRALQVRFPKLGGVSVFLKKQIPVGAGLGGGSSNAAFFLLGMKKMYGLKVSKRELLQMGAKLGADVPFFLHNVNQAIGIGRGDELTPKLSKAKHVFLLATSAHGLSTKEVFEGLKGKIRPVTLTKVSRDITMLCALLAKKNYSKVEPFLQNDLEVSAFELRPSLRGVLESFRTKGISAVRMTGSGPTVFAILSNLHEAKRAQKDLQKELCSHELLLCHSL